MFFALVKAQDVIRPFQYGIFIYNNVTKGLLVDNGADPNLRASYEAIEISKLGYSTGFFTRFNLSPISKLNIGLNYLNTGERTKRQVLIFGDQLDPVLGFITPEGGFDEHRFVYTYHHIEIPVNYEFHFGGFYTTSGISTVLNVRNTINSKIYKPDGSIESNTDEYGNGIYEFKKVNAVANIGFGYEFSLGPVSGYSCFYTQTFLSGVMQDAELNRRPFSYGLSFGVIL